MIRSGLPMLGNQGFKISSKAKTLKICLSAESFSEFARPHPQATAQREPTVATATTHHERSKKLDKRPTEGCLKHGPISLSRSGVLMIMGLIE